MDILVRGEFASELQLHDVALLGDPPPAHEDVAVTGFEPAMAPNEAPVVAPDEVALGTPGRCVGDLPATAGTGLWCVHHPLRARAVMIRSRGRPRGQRC